MRRLPILFFLAPLVALAACGSKEEGSNQVQMRDMEVVDGTISDGMTDLDAARADGTALMPGSGNSSDAKPKAKPAENSAAPAEVVADE